MSGQNEHTGPKPGLHVLSALGTCSEMDGRMQTLLRGGEHCTLQELTGRKDPLQQDRLHGLRAKMRSDFLHEQCDE